MEHAGRQGRVRVPACATVLLRLMGDWTVPARARTLRPVRPTTVGHANAPTGSLSVPAITQWTACWSGRGRASLYPLRYAGSSALRDVAAGRIGHDGLSSPQVLRAITTPYCIASKDKNIVATSVCPAVHQVTHGMRLRLASCTWISKYNIYICCSVCQWARKSMFRSRTLHGAVNVLQPEWATSALVISAQLWVTCCTLGSRYVERPQNVPPMTVRVHGKSMAGFKQSPQSHLPVSVLAISDTTAFLCIAGTAD